MSATSKAGGARGPAQRSGVELLLLVLLVRGRHARLMVE
jgi:hypothetical protein